MSIYMFLRYQVSRARKISTAILMKASFDFARFFFACLPYRLGFFVLVLMRLVLSRGMSHFSRAYMKSINRRLRGRDVVFAYQFLSHLFPLSTVDILMRVGALSEAASIITLHGNLYNTEESILLASRIYFETADFKSAKEVLFHCLISGKSDHNLAHMAAMLELLCNNEADALSYLTYYSASSPSGWCPHQNISARYPSNYLPTPIDHDAGDEGLLYDAYNFLGQRVTHVGAGHLGVKCYKRAYELQDQLLSRGVKISSDLTKWLDRHNLKLDSLKILPWEWTTQVGHLGMLDILFRMRKLGWWHGNAIILLPKVKSQAKIANEVILSLYQSEAKLVQINYNITLALYDELFSLQRYYGMAFNAWRFSNGEVVPWQDAGARLMVEWEDCNRELPLQTQFDNRYTNSYLLGERIKNFKQSFGMKNDDWYVCLHLRDSEYYSEVSGSGQSHRNSDVDSYLSAINYIIQRGGWVIKMGGKHSPELPKMERVIDYARSKYRCELFDVYLIRYAKFFIGTTSGLTNIAISMGVPCALVNCITVDAQLWSSKVKFILKRIRREDGSFITQREITTAPWRWRLFTAELLKRLHAIALNNTEDEILEIVKEIDLMASGSVIPDSNKLIEKWKKCLGVENFYGLAQPSLYYLNKYKDDLLDPVQVEEVERVMVKSYENELIDCAI